MAAGPDQPSFMYNTLFSIKCAVDMGRKDEAGHMLTTFIQLLRGVLSGPDEMMTIRSQMESIRQYVELQRFRYDGAFDALIECDEQAADCLIPKLLIQPLVENAILHGVNMEDGSGMITVIARRQGDTVAVQVEDNGKGMTQERIREVMNAAEDADSSHLGVRNIHDRIRLHFGEEWGLHIESTPGQGTQITLRFRPGTETSYFAISLQDCVSVSLCQLESCIKGEPMLKVLVVDDEAPIRQWLEYCVDQFDGFTVAGAAASGVQGLDIYRRELPDIVVSDIEMPGMDGLEMLRRMQKIHSAYMIILTSHEDFSYARQALTQERQNIF